LGAVSADDGDAASGRARARLAEVEPTKVEGAKVVRVGAVSAGDGDAASGRAMARLAAVVPAQVEGAGTVSGPSALAHGSEAGVETRPILGAPN
jgi:hypothetical protein